MATIGLDASYIFDKYPTGTSTYSRKLIESLAGLDMAHRFLVCYRLSRLRQRREFLCPTKAVSCGGPQFSVRVFQQPFTFWLPWQTDLFHSLAQRPPAFRFRREVVTIFDIFPITSASYSTPAFQQRFSGLLREAMDRASCIITSSEYTSRQMQEHCGVDAARIRVIPCGVDPPVSVIGPEEALAERERLVGKGNHMLLTVGAIDNRKNTINSLRALKLLPERYHLVLAGGDGFGSGAVHAFIADEGLSSRVHTLGYAPADRIPVLYQAASALLFPSLEEGFGIPVLEAMSYGLPVVTSSTSSLPEVGGDAALYCDPRNPSDMAAKVADVIESPGLAAGLSRKGRERVRQFTWKRTAEETLKVYEELL
jgi:glycosyltransferase involved in cell wall biosynthesis